MRLLLDLSARMRSSINTGSTGSGSEWLPIAELNFTGSVRFQLYGTTAFTCPGRATTPVKGLKKVPPTGL